MSISEIKCSSYYLNGVLFFEAKPFLKVLDVTHYSPIVSKFINIDQLGILFEMSKIQNKADIETWIYVDVLQSLSKSSKECL